MIMESWSDQYIGIPYRQFGRDRAGCDCWGLARLVYAERLKIELPSYIGAYASVEEHAEIAAEIADAKSSRVWREVASPMPFDLAVFRRGRYETHVGIVIKTGLMLHIAADDQAKLEHYISGRWIHRLSGIYRHCEAPLKVMA